MLIIKGLIKVFLIFILALCCSPHNSGTVEIYFFVQGLQGLRLNGMLFKSFKVYILLSKVREILAMTVSKLVGNVGSF